MRVLVTRPFEDAQALRDELAAMGVAAVLAPLTRIDFLEVPPEPVAGYQALLLTSRNGADAAGRAALDRSIRVFAVGEATAEQARGHGFGHVESAGGDVADLAALARARLDPAAGPLLFIGAEILAGDLEGALTAAGFEVCRVVGYRTVAVECLPEEAMAALAEGTLAEGTLDGALFFASSAGAAFVSLVEGAGLTASCGGMTAYCMSASVAESVAGLAWKEIRVANAPTKGHLLALLADPCHKDA